MKSVAALFVSLGFMFMATAQDSWKLVHNGKLRMKATEETELKNSFPLRIADLNKKGALSIVYKEGDAEKDWVRTIMVVSPGDAELASFKGTTVSIQNAVLRSLFKKSTTLKLYTMSLPSDPAKAALVRVRRVHLATITLIK